jgi:hypothetical protein
VRKHFDRQRPNAEQRRKERELVRRRPSTQPVYSIVQPFEQQPQVCKHGVAARRPELA